MYIGIENPDSNDNTYEKLRMMCPLRKFQATFGLGQIFVLSLTDEY